MSTFDWTCPACDKAQIIHDESVNQQKITIAGLRQINGTMTLEVTTVACANTRCKQATVVVTLFNRIKTPNRPGGEQKFLVYKLRLLPQGNGISIPDCVPDFIAKDFHEAYSIRSLSPNASATLARRCLQSMIRDFCKIREKSLAKEISELKKRVENRTAPLGITLESIEAIDNVRKMGNIGAHMEMSSDLIINVEAGEPEILLTLIYNLFKDWYLANYNRKETYSALDQLVANKTNPSFGEPTTSKEVL